MPKGFSAKLPLSYSKSEGPYLLTKTLEENARQNLKTLIFTIPGERVMNSDFGVGFSTLLFENANNEVVENLRERLISQVAKYLPYIELGEIIFNSPVDNSSVADNFLGVSIRYSIKRLNIGDVLEIPIN